MNEETCCITSKRKTAKNNWKYDSDFLPALCIVCKKLRQFFFHTVLANVLKERHISSVRSYKYLNKSINEV